MIRRPGGSKTTNRGVTFILKACPRCLGDLALQRDPVTGDYYSCLQCGVEVAPKVVGVTS